MTTLSAWGVMFGVALGCWAIGGWVQRQTPYIGDDLHIAGIMWRSFAVGLLAGALLFTLLLLPTLFRGGP